MHINLELTNTVHLVGTHQHYAFQLGYYTLTQFDKTHYTMHLNLEGTNTMHLNILTLTQLHMIQHNQI